MQEQRGDLQSVAIPEFGPEARVYYFQRLNGREMAQLFPFVDWEEPNNTSREIYFEAFGVAARDESGAKLFNGTNWQQLRDTWDFDLVVRLVEQMGVLRQLFATGNDAKKG